MKSAVLFLCTGNSARSQMAEALLRREAPDRFDVYSAGTDPQGINPLSVEALKEVGIEIGDQRSKHLSEYLGKIPVRYLIIVCDRADRECPTAWPGAFTRLAWPFEDPAACKGDHTERLAKFRAVRDQIHSKIKTWLADQGQQS
jgi:arsenate reductase